MRTQEPERPGRAPGTRVHFPPVENGLDYLVNVVERLSRGGGTVGPKDLKYAVLHLQAATEVLLKYRLFLEHWTLVLQDLDLSRKNPNKRVTREIFDGGDFISCTPAETVVRLRNIVGVSIEPDEEKEILALAKSRNALQHYGLTDAEGTIEVRTAKVLDFLIRFLDDELLPELDEEDRERVEDDVEHIRSGLTRVEAFVSQRMARLRDQLGPFQSRTFQCPYCEQWALVATGGSTICLFCPANLDTGMTAWDYATDILRLPWRSAPSTGPFARPATAQVERCPDCGVFAVVRGAITAAAPAFAIDFCFHCSRDFAACAACDQLVDTVDDERRCDTCRLTT
jgi:hypothetical protein